MTKSAADTGCCGIQSNSSPVSESGVVGAISLGATEQNVLAWKVEGRNDGWRCRDCLSSLHQSPLSRLDVVQLTDFLRLRVAKVGFQMLGCVTCRPSW